MTTTPEPLRAPWTVEQVTVLNRYQHIGFFHPFTCGRCRDAFGADVDERLLVATRAGWICPTCDYTQDWCWPFMADLSAPWMRDDYDPITNWQRHV